MTNRSERLNSILEQRKTSEEILKQYDRIDLGGAVLIDGHHVFLNIVREIEDFNQAPKDWLKSIRANDSEKVISDIMTTNVMAFDPTVISMFYGWLCRHMQDRAQAFVFHRLFQDSRQLLSPSSLNHFVWEGASSEEILAKYPPCDWVVSANESKGYIFDASMPNKQEVVTSLRKSYDYWLRRNERNANNIYIFLELAENDEWAFYENDIRGSITTPYDLKNTLLETAGKEWTWGDFELVLQERWISAFSGRVMSIEKGVDTNLVIRGCELANDSACDWVWLITNDGDHAPLIRHIREKNKEVFLTSITDRPSKRLVGELASALNFLNLPKLFQHEPPPEDLANEIDTSWELRFWLLGRAMDEISNKNNDEAFS